MTELGAWKSGNIPFCMKFDCLNRDKKCRECWKYSDYVVKDAEQENTDGKEKSV